METTGRNANYLRARCPLQLRAYTHAAFGGVSATIGYGLVGQRFASTVKGFYFKKKNYFRLNETIASTERRLG
ncbi:MAG TPA: hypothetical protein VJY62_08530 [Bacteroidia bacterium]|nr:hypothetical protein [Bacteroidia bacterium]